MLQSCVTAACWQYSSLQSLLVTLAEIEVDVEVEVEIEISVVTQVLPASRARRSWYRLRSARSAMQGGIISLDSAIQS